MKKMFSVLAIFGLASCAIQQLNSNMEQTNELMEQNRVAIEENTRHIAQSTAAMQQAQWVFPLILLALIIVYFGVQWLRKGR